MGFFDFLSNNAETSELHSVMDLRTRYYKTSYKKVKEQVEAYAEEQNITVKHVNDVHGEIFLQTGNYHMIVSIIQVTPLETAVDMKVQTYKLMGMSLPKKLILQMYAFLNINLTFKGTSLHP
jgi:hypothetical protein